jgi:hypothetical protein
MIPAVQKFLSGKKTHALAWGAAALAMLQAHGIVPVQVGDVDLHSFFSEHSTLTVYLAALVSSIRAGIAKGGVSATAAKALLLAFLLPLLGGCATSTTTQQGLSKAERWVGVVQTGVIGVRDVEHQIAADATASGDLKTAASARKIETAATNALPYVTIAKDGLAAARGDPDAQARILNDLVARFAHSDPAVAAAVAFLPPLIQELVAEAQAAHANPTPAPNPPAH